MADVYTNQVVQDTPFPDEDAIVSTTPASESGVQTNTTTKPKSFPTKRIAVELIGSVLNTKSRKILQAFEFTQSGALQIGKFENGISGDIKISPAGIVARDTAGNTTFALDGETGDATFKGTIQAGALVSGAVAVGPDGDIFIDGENKRMIFYNGGIPAIVIGEI